MTLDFQHSDGSSMEECIQECREWLDDRSRYLLNDNGQITYVYYGTNSRASIPPVEPEIVKALVDEGFLVPKAARNGARAYELASI